eukprot:TRINITY_DN15562_c0_g1_i1.p3 TRINITY_DN15562_c0_g1~~TRINITY_DN15562_c0_g1_i1.p3  ORF type:complete len:123 (-),score=6.40 TRINITY_DN15562_c0_g1_i1:8-376(-)
MLVTHDRYLIQRVCDQILELDRSALNVYPIGCGYDRYLEMRAERIASADATAQAAGRSCEGRRSGCASSPRPGPPRRSPASMRSPSSRRRPKGEGRGPRGHQFGDEGGHCQPEAPSGGWWRN